MLACEQTQRDTHPEATLRDVAPPRCLRFNLFHCDAVQVRRCMLLPAQSERCTLDYCCALCTSMRIGAGTSYSWKIFSSDLPWPPTRFIVDDVRVDFVAWCACHLILHIGSGESRGAANTTTLGVIIALYPMVCISERPGVLVPTHFDNLISEPQEFGPSMCFALLRAVCK